MPENRIFAANRAGKIAHLLQFHHPSTELIELAAMAGMDGVDLDGEHGHFDLSEVDAICRLANAYGMTVTARVSAIDASVINGYLARGVQGITGPHMETAEQAKILVDATLFLPEGERSWGPARGNVYGHTAAIKDLHGGNTEFLADANANMLVIAQIESRLGLENVDEILDVDGIDCITFGPNDMAASLGRPGEPGHADVAEAHRHITERVRVHGKRLLTDRITTVRATSIVLDALRGHMADHGDDTAGEGA
jgi:2-keto-3-deoxy-L-rhamnonate aldolase RhmA|tara:strand:- start:1945 stop:2703 length:759 start_codon:yes stop_codon:yes gene_type:complete